MSGKFAEFKKMPINLKKKKRRDRAKGTDDGEDIRDEIADKIEEQKIKKAKSKSLFTRQKNHLADLLEDGVVSNREIRASRKKLDEAQENVVEDLTSLAALYSEARDRHAVEKTSRELEEIEKEFCKAQESVQEYLAANKDELSSQASGFSGKLLNLHSQESKARQRVTELEERLRVKEESVKRAQKQMEEEYARCQKELEAEVREAKEELARAKGDCKEKYSKLEGAIDEELELSLPSPPKRDVKPEQGEKTAEESPKQELGKDMWKQLTRVSIPVFSGDKRSYGSWKAAFMACVDKAPATAEYKLLQLKKYLSGEALAAVESLGHSAEAYEAAKSRLERKFGGQRRQIYLHLEELDQFRPIRPGNAKDLDRLADLLDVIVIKLKEAGRKEELGNGSLYMKIQKKMTSTMLANYNRWVFEQKKVECVETLREWILQEAEFQTVAAETLCGLTGKRRDSSHTFFGRTSGSGKPVGTNCPLCRRDHPVWSCLEFKKLDVQSRWQKAKQLRLCYRCLGRNHKGGQCAQNSRCGIDGCQKTHNRALHGDQFVNGGIVSESQVIEPERSLPLDMGASENNAHSSGTEGERCSRPEHSLTTTMATTKAPEPAKYLALRTVPVVVKNGERRMIVNALLDDGSTKTYVNGDVAAELGLEGSTQRITVNVLNGEEDSFETMPVEFDLQSIDGKTCARISAFTATRVTGNMRPVNWKEQSGKWKHLQGVNFPNLGPRPIIDMLIGIDYAELHFSIRDVRGQPGEPVARLTPLGWTCIGAPKLTEDSAQQTNLNMAYFVHQQEKELSSALQKFWEVDSSGSIVEREVMKKEEVSAIKAFESSVQFKGERYEVEMPWKPNAPELPNNYEMAVNRLISTEKRLLKDPQLAASYSEVIGKYTQKGYISKVTPSETEEKTWYLPHFAIVRPEKSTTKTRVVFDASAKFNGLSLNDVICQGPKLQRDIFDVLLRFRRFPVALVCDIAEMYLRIGLSPSSRPFHRFLWRDIDQSRPPDVYQFNSLVFGVNSCPYQAQFVSQKHARENQEHYPRAAETILESTYMDDSMDSSPSEEECVKLYEELSALWGSAGMHARKWLSNSEQVLKKIPVEDRAAEVDLDKGNLPSMKTLGVLWLAKEDVFTYRVNPPEEKFQLTKRNFLRKIAMLFDPMGFLAPYVIRAKILLQEMWTSGMDWDDPLDPSQAKQAKRWFEELSELSDVRVPRCLQLNSLVETVTLHTFTDASGDAYGAVTYARYQYKCGTVSTSLVASKTRVAPLSATSIPRLELMGAVLGLRLALSIAKVLKIDQSLLTFWSDSMNVLWWIRRPSRSFRPFIANRIGEIHDSCSPTQWRHVGTHQNPADLPTRGMTVTEVKGSEMWWKGPKFLSMSEDTWPKTEIDVTPEATLEVRKKARGAFDVPGTESVLFALTPQTTWRLHPSRYSSWTRLLRVRAWVHRFVNNCGTPPEGRSSGELSSQEISDAETDIIKEAQQEAFQDEYKALVKFKSVPQNSKLLSLNPILDEDGLLRSDGRLRYADYLPFDARYPVILPRKSWVTRLIVKSYHERSNHAVGTNHTLSLLSARFWIMQGREEIRDCERECCECRKRKAKAAKQIMAPLPKIRLKLPLRAFARTAVDFAGPFVTIQGRGKKRAKRYLCLFTCLTSRAIHLEMAYGLDTDSFLNAFYRMANRRGLPEEMISDNGTNFVGAERELKELVEQLDPDKIEKSAANKGIKWSFNPPWAPHFGGVHETMIKSAKRATYAILGTADVTDEELMTAFTGAEALINSRPLTYQSANPSDDTPITPNHFLIGQVGGQFAPGSVDSGQFSPKKRWRRVQELVRHFWHRWLREWLPTLNRRSKWQKEQKDIRVNDVVLVVAPDTPRGQWPLGRVLAVFPGKDKHVRAVKVRVGRKELLRPITRICPLELLSEDNAEE